MIMFRSLVFNVILFVWAVTSLPLMIVFLPFPPMVMRRVVRGWSYIVLGFTKGIVGINHEFRGLEHLPEGSVILASKHQSAWDTAIFYLLVPDPIYVMKKELLAIPFWGWYARRAQSIAVDRSAGASALKSLVADGKATVGRGNQIIIFPEGTRTAPGTHYPYQPGIAALYAKTQAPVVPVALNSGLFWPRRGFKKMPGTIVVELLEPMPEGLDRRTFMAELERRIETACACLPGLSAELVDNVPASPVENGETGE